MLLWFQYCPFNEPADREIEVFHGQGGVDDTRHVGDVSVKVGHDVKGRAEVVDEHDVAIANVAFAPPAGGGITEAVQEMAERRSQPWVPRVAVWTIAQDKAGQVTERQIEFGQVIDAGARNVRRRRSKRDNL
jgi:hypothetical protein